MHKDNHSVLRKFLGEVVIILPDLVDPVADPDAVTSDADIRYMGILDDADDRVLQLLPYFLIPRKPDSERELAIAKILAPGRFEGGGGFQARIKRGGASLDGASRSRAGALMKRPKIIPIEQCDSIQVYSEETSAEALTRLLDDMPAVGASESTDSFGIFSGAPTPPDVIRVPDHRFFEEFESVVAICEDRNSSHVYVSNAGETSPVAPVQQLLAIIADGLQKRAMASEAAAAIVEQAEDLSNKCSILDPDTDVLSLDGEAQLIDPAMQERAARDLLLGFAPLIESLLESGLAGGGPTSALLVGIPSLSARQEQFLRQLGCSHPRLVYVAGVA